MKIVFAERLESLRGTLTQRKFAQMLGVPLTSYTNWIAGISTLKADSIVMICSKLGVSADWLLGLKDTTANAEAAIKLEGLTSEIKAILEKYSQ